MLALAILISQLGATLLIAAWLTAGLRDNILYPTQNETFTAQVMTMARIRDEFPEAFAPVAHRAVTDRRLQLLAFRFIVLAEVVVTAVLWLGAAALVLALTGSVTPETARALALFGALGFTGLWGGFLVAGNHFCYWFGHEGAQNTHFQMTLWGMGTMILLALPAG